MSTDDNVDRAVRDAGYDLALLGRREEPTEHLDPDRERREPFLHRREVLLCKQRCRDQDSRLFPVLNRLEHRTQRNLGLAEPHVTEDQTVHRRLGFHIRLHIGDRRQLVGRLFVRERSLELALPRCIGVEPVSRGAGPCPVQIYHGLGYHGHGLPDLAARLGPLRAAHAGQARRLTPGVATDGRELVGRDIELVTGGVLDEQVVACSTGDIPVHEAFEPSNAMVMVDNVIAGVQISIGLFVAFSAPPANGAMRSSAPGHLTFADNGDAKRRKDEAVVDAAREHCGLDGLEDVDHGESGTGLGQKAGDTRRSARAVHRDDHVGSSSGPARDRRGDGIRISGCRSESPHFVAFISRRGRYRRSLEHIDPVGRLKWQIEGRVGSRFGRTFAPCTRQCFCEISLFGYEVAAPILGTLRIEQHHDGVGLVEDCLR